MLHNLPFVMAWEPPRVFTNLRSLSKEPTVPCSDPPFHGLSFAKEQTTTPTEPKPEQHTPLQTQESDPELNPETAEPKPKPEQKTKESKESKDPVDSSVQRVCVPPSFASAVMRPLLHTGLHWIWMEVRPYVGIVAGLGICLFVLHVVQLVLLLHLLKKNRYMCSSVCKHT